MEIVKREDSKSIESLRYNEQTGELYVKFKRGGEHMYHDVPADLFEDFSSAPSLGQFFLKNIRKQYRSTKLG